MFRAESSQHVRSSGSTRTQSNSCPALPQAQAHGGVDIVFCLAQPPAGHSSNMEYEARLPLTPIPLRTAPMRRKEKQIDHVGLACCQDRCGTGCAVRTDVAPEGMVVAGQLLQQGGELRARECRQMPRRRRHRRRLQRQTLDHALQVADARLLLHLRAASASTEKFTKPRRCCNEQSMDWCLQLLRHAPSWQQDGVVQ